jgi:Holliday junction resolvase-like predicted endonuclease
MTNSEKGKLGEQYVEKYLLSKGYEIVKNKENGCDLIVIKNKRIIKIEIKTTANLSGGIPDMHSSEFCLTKGKYLLSLTIFIY